MKQISLFIVGLFSFAMLMQALNGNVIHTAYALPALAVGTGPVPAVGGGPNPGPVPVVGGGPNPWSGINSFLTPNQFNGVMTRWEINKTGELENGNNGSQRDVRYSVTPHLSGMSLSDWFNDLVMQGVNIGALNLDPSIDLAQGEEISEKDWQNYLYDLYLPHPTKDQQNFINQIRDQIGRYQYTSAQRNEAQIDFLQRLEGLKNAGLISENIHFILNQRLWFIKGVDGNTGVVTPLSPQEIQKTEQEFSQDMAGFINQAKALGLDHWLAGIHLVEHGDTDMNQVLPFVVDIATEVNSMTGGWLQQRGHGFIANGGGWGADYNGINNVSCPIGAGPGNKLYQFTCSTGAFPFFNLISRQTGWFTFGYKFMEFNNVQYYDNINSDGQLSAEHYIDGVMQAYCTKFSKCNPESVTSENWQNFLTDNTHGLGFKDLVKFISMNALEYPNHANVIFVGDNSDSVATMIGMKEAACIKADPECAIEAVRNMFTIANVTGGGWIGRMFIDGSDDPTTRDVPPGTSSDDGQSIKFIDYDPIDFKGSHLIILDTNTYVLWKSWQKNLSGIFKP